MQLSLFVVFLSLNAVVFSDMLIFGSGASATLTMETDIPTKRCRYNKVYSMLQANCSHRDLQEIPTNLRADTQILIANRNRIGELNNNSFKAYTSIAYLYLAENFLALTGIEEGTFAPLQSLEVLDLTKNGLSSLPKSLLSLPLLRTLYLAENKFTNDIFPPLEFISSPLVILDMTKNQLTEVPELGLLPTLKHMNLSENRQIKEITIDSVAPYCSLKKLDFSKIGLTFDDADCQCHDMKAWIKLRQITTVPEISCSSASYQSCQSRQFSNETLALYNGCKEIIRLKEESESARATWIKVVICTTAFILTTFATLYCIQRYKNSQSRLKGDSSGCRFLPISR